MKVRSAVLGIAVLIAGSVWAPATAAVQPAPAPLAGAAGPKVAIVVGPVGGVTSEYRRLAEEAAQAALAYTRNVVRVYSPNATWATVKAALQDASVVVYLGHGNGWPSRYRKAPHPLTQNGFGLNPVAGVDDRAHQYFGEDRLATDIALARNAVVILSRLCYASGNSEPGLPEGTIAVARQRVDNYAAGFIAAGAGAVIAEGHDGPARYVREVLAGKETVEAIWRSAPTFHNHVRTFKSVRSPGYVALMDPDRPASGFYRSLVMKPGLPAVHAPDGSAPATTVTPTEPTLIGTGLTLSSTTLADRPSVGRKTQLRIRYTIEDPTRLPEGLRVGVRWDPIDLPATSAPASPSPSVGTDTTAPADETLIAPEQTGSIVTPRTAKVDKKHLSVTVWVPKQQGRYRVVLTLHDANRDAFDAASQTLIKPVVVRVTGKVDASYRVSPLLATTASTRIDLPVTVTNLGLEPWGQVGLPQREPGTGGLRRRPDQLPSSAILVARWVPLDPALDRANNADTQVALPPGLPAATRTSVTLSTPAPSRPGNYLLLLDVVVPGTGSLASLGIGPQLVRVTVAPTVH